jgi:hypothetical protein
MAAVERTAVLVIRAWLEEEIEEDALRARITQSLDVSSTETSERRAASKEEILIAVEEWLQAFVGSQ